MLIHHFGAETQGFQGLDDLNDRGKAWVPALRTTENKGKEYPNAYCISLMKIFFYLPGCKPVETNFSQNIWDMFGHNFATGGPNELIFLLHA